MLEIYIRNKLDPNTDTPNSNKITVLAPNFCSIVSLELYNKYNKRQYITLVFFKDKFALNKVFRSDFAKFES